MIGDFLPPAANRHPVLPDDWTLWLAVDDAMVTSLPEPDHVRREPDPDFLAIRRAQSDLPTVEKVLTKRVIYQERERFARRVDLKHWTPSRMRPPDIHKRFQLLATAMACLSILWTRLDRHVLRS